MSKKMHPGVDQDLIKQMEQHAKVADAGFVNNFSVADAIKQDVRDSVPVDGLLTIPPQKTEEYKEEVSSSDFNVNVPEVEESVDDSIPPEDPEERLDWTIKQMEGTFVKHPSREQMKYWKNQHGDIFICNFGDKLFVYRYLKRIEWTNMQRTTRMDEMTPDQLEHMFIEKCLLFPQTSPEFMYNLPAGLVTMLSQQIQMNSGFMNPEYLSQFTIKL